MITIHNNEAALISGGVPTAKTSFAYDVGYVGTALVYIDLGIDLDNPGLLAQGAAALALMF